MGSNLGDRMENLRRAVARLRLIAVADEPFQTALVYQTEPCRCPEGSPDFYNTVVEFEYAGSAQDLFQATSSIEDALGRQRGDVPNAPRVIDLDVLYVGDFECRTDELELPHPRLGERRFVLQPLCDIRPDLVLPGEVVTVAELLSMLPIDDAPLVALDQYLTP